MPFAKKSKLKTQEIYSTRQLGVGTVFHSWNYFLEFFFKKNQEQYVDKAHQVAKRAEAQKAQPNHFSGGGSSLISWSPVPLDPAWAFPNPNPDRRQRLPLLEPQQTSDDNRCSARTVPTSGDNRLLCSPMAVSFSYLHQISRSPFLGDLRTGSVRCSC